MDRPRARRRTHVVGREFHEALAAYAADGVYVNYVDQDENGFGTPTGSGTNGWPNSKTSGTPTTSSG
jgi:hypothetical protein